MTHHVLKSGPHVARSLSIPLQRVYHFLASETVRECGSELVTLLYRRVELTTRRPSLYPTITIQMDRFDIIESRADIRRIQKDS